LSSREFFTLHSKKNRFVRSFLGESTAQNSVLTDLELGNIQIQNRAKCGAIKGHALETNLFDRKR
jgi:hypothetical protein